MLRKSQLFVRSAACSVMVAALALGTVGMGVVAAPAAAKEAAAPKYSPEFIKVAGPFQNELGAVQKSKDAAKAAALAPKWEALVAAAKTPDDKFLAGQFGIAITQIAKDAAMQARALELTVDSGKLEGAELGKYQFYLGASKYDAKDYAGAQGWFAKAMASGAAEPDLPALLAETYFAQNQNQAGLDVLIKAIEARRAAGGQVPQEWYRRGLGVAFNGKLRQQAAQLSNGLVASYPSPQNWAGAIGVLRTITNYQPQEMLDLMRLIDRTNSWSEGSEYLDYVQVADARRAPGEVIKIIDKGVTAGKVNAADAFVKENKALATARLAADKASLPSAERDARAPAATAVVAMAAGDAFLSYDDPAKAEALYRIALTKPGVDADRVNTRLGIAQFDQGRFAEAQATFAKVAGTRKPIAELWSIYAAQKAKGG